MREGSFKLCTAAAEHMELTRSCRAGPFLLPSYSWYIFKALDTPLAYLRTET
jgi:hypothetical protein